MAKKIYISYDHDKDVVYYDMLSAWFSDSDVTFVSHSLPSDIKNTPKSLTNAVNGINEKMRGTSAFVILISENTKDISNNMLFEINLALGNDIPIIAVNVNGLRYIDENNCPSILKDKHVLHIAMNSRVLRLAIEIWPDYYKSHPEEALKGPRFFADKAYEEQNTTERK